MDFALNCDRMKVLVGKAVDVQLAVDTITMRLKTAQPMMTSRRPSKPSSSEASSSTLPRASLNQVACQFLHIKPVCTSDCDRDPPEKTTKGRSRTRAAVGAPAMVVIEKPAVLSCS
jgi:hypothetical protein